MDMVMRVDVRQDLPDHVCEHAALPFEFLPLRSKIAEVDDLIAGGEVHVKAETQVWIFACQSACRLGSWHVDHEARTGHDPALVRRDYAPVGPLVPTKVIGVDDQAAFASRIAGCGRPWPE